MKKILSIIVISTAALILAGCNSKKDEENTVQQSQVILSNAEEKFSETSAKENPVPQAAHAPSKSDFQPDSDSDYGKINLVLSKMSSRAQNELSFSDKDDFLKDLNYVLAQEKTFKQNDLSLYYLIDKKHNVGSSYVPKDLITLKKNNYYQINKPTLSLRPDVEKALTELAKGALKDGITITVSSTYRSYDYQTNLFNYWVKVDGLEEAERESARPGTSQHQLGVAIDFGNIDDSFINTKEGKWLDAHAREYGWSLSFPKQYEDITGYRWECWHYRYIGIPACRFQEKWFKNVQQYMLEFIDLWKSL